MNEKELLLAGVELAGYGLNLANGSTADPAAIAKDVARKVSGLLVKLVPIDELKGYLDDGAKSLVNIAADGDAKFKMGERP